MQPTAPEVRLSTGGAAAVGARRGSRTGSESRPGSERRVGIEPSGSGTLFNTGGSLAPWWVQCTPTWRFLDTN
jgi:hypothetical protein